MKYLDQREDLVVFARRGDLSDVNSLIDSVNLQVLEDSNKSHGLLFLYAKVRRVFSKSDFSDFIAGRDCAAFHAAAKNGWVDVVERLLDFKPVRSHLLANQLRLSEYQDSVLETIITKIPPLNAPINRMRGIT